MGGFLRNGRTTKGIKALTHKLLKIFVCSASSLKTSLDLNEDFGVPKFVCGRWSPYPQRGRLVSPVIVLVTIAIEGKLIFAVLAAR